MGAEPNSIRVLVADDDPLARELVQAVIAGDPALQVVATAEDAAGATALALEHKPDVAVLDWVMPGGGGPQAARDIQRESPDTRIVALTASDSGEASLDMLRAGAQSFLVKGGPPEELLATIHRAMRL